MGADQHHHWTDIAATTLDWWAESGVDIVLDDVARDWLAPPAPRAVAAPVAAADPIQTGPGDYAGFWSWRSGAGAPERDWSAAILSPEGPHDADLLLLVDHPNGDSMLGGEEGALLDRILAAIGRSRDDVLIAGLAMARPIADAISPDAIPALATAAHRLLALTPAKTVMTIGHTTSRAVLEADGAPATRGLHGINRSGRELQALAIAHPRFMMKHPQAKREAWRCLQSLLGGQA